LKGVGADADAAASVAASMVEADRFGIGTHGLVRLPSYCAQVRSGEIHPRAKPRVERESGPTALVDGARAFGAVTARFSMREAIVRAEVIGIGLALARGGLHFGAASCYSRRAAEAGLVGLVATNTPAVMAPWGGAEARIGNNPVSLAAPMPSGSPPFVLDIALSAVSRGTIKVADLSGDSIPEGWALDAAGRATTSPAAALAGVLLPFGRHKGSGLALAIEVLTGCLAGGDLGAELINSSLTGGPQRTSGSRLGTVSSLYLAVSPDCFGGREAFLERMGRLADAVRSTPHAPGFAEVLLPGDLEARAAEAAARDGIGLDASTVALLSAFGEAERLDCRLLGPGTHDRAAGCVSVLALRSAVREPKRSA